MDYPTLLRRLRHKAADLLGEDTDESARVTRIIYKVKARLNPQWEAESARARKLSQDRYMRLMT